MRPCETIEGARLKGQKRSGAWHIGEKIKREPNASGGTFSVGYRAINEDGTEGYVKATDIGLITMGAAGSRLLLAQQALSEQTFERDILDICSGNNMDRVVHALDYGELDVVVDGVRDVVFFIIFEMADGDVRQQIDRQKRKELAWAAQALHNLSVAIQQLHSAQIAHNDVKPSNLLVFGDLT
jgi:serine/threonine protein kinase